VAAEGGSFIGWLPRYRLCRQFANATATTRVTQIESGAVAVKTSSANSFSLSHPRQGLSNRHNETLLFRTAMLLIFEP
jgi:hypothetical protein